AAATRALATLLATLAALFLALLAAVATLLPHVLALFARVDLRHHRPVLVARLRIGKLAVRGRGRADVSVDRGELALLVGELGRLVERGLGLRFLDQRGLHRGLGEDLRLDHLGGFSLAGRHFFGLLAPTRLLGRSRLLLRGSGFLHRGLLLRGTLGASLVGALLLRHRAASYHAFQPKNCGLGGVP